MFKVAKRDGRIVDFDISKISTAITKAFVATKTNFNPDIIDLLALKASADFVKKVDNDVIGIEDIQDSVESVLSRSGYDDVAKAYILYRKQHEKMRNVRNTLLDYKKTVDGYLKVADWRVKENSTVTYSVGGLILSNSGAMTANYWLSEVYDEEVANAHRNADIHLHDLSMLTGYCFTGDTRVITLDGKNPTFKELVDAGTDKLWVYAYDRDSNQIVPAIAVAPRITKEVSELVEVTLTNNQRIRCTPDHLFMLRDGSWCKASELRSNTSLMPLYVGTKGTYCSINKAWHNQTGRMYLHRWVAQFGIGRALEPDEVVHHINGDKHDNRPENLAVVNDSNHRRYELSKTMETEKWKAGNRARLVQYNRSEEKRASVSAVAAARARDKQGKFVSFAWQPEKDQQKEAYNHCVRSVTRVALDEPIAVYDLTVPGYENFAVNGGVFVHNCAGWSLKQLIQEGLGGVEGKITSAPASHLSTLCNQMVNFLGIMQNEWAGAQAFSSFDTYLAPFVKVDHLPYKEVKQCIQSFVFGVNTPSRWGCVDTDTEVLSVDGFKKFNELQEGDLIYTWHDGKLELNPVRKVVQKPFKGKLHSYTARGYNQTVTPNHRVLVRKHNSKDCVIKHSEEIFDVKTPFSLPVAFESSAIPASDLADEQIRLAAMVYTDGSIDMRNGSVHKVTIFKSPNRIGNEDIVRICKALGLEYTMDTKDGEWGPVNEYRFYGDAARYILDLVGQKDSIAKKFMSMDARQAMLFLETWASFDGCEEKLKLQYDNETIKSQLQQIAILAGHASYDCETEKANYVKVRLVDSVCPTERSEVDYDGIVWCPNVENGTAVFRKDGTVYISGQTQAPFSNITLDWTVPADLAELPCIVGGKEMDFCYKDCKPEMDMVNKAFIEVMLEGDANGRGFQYPIPTYSITRDFDWSETENNKLLFEMTAKYGTPYFSNYVNSDMEPSDIRSMCPLRGDQKVLVMDDYSKEFHISSIGNLSTDKVYTLLLNGETKRARINKFNGLKFYRVHTVNGHEIVLSHNHLNLVLNGEIKTTEALTTNDYLPFNIVPNNGEGLDYETGLMVGAFMGDGTLKDDYSVVYSLNNDSKAELMANIIAIGTNKFGAKVHLNDCGNHCINVTLTSKMLRGVIEDYVSGKGIEKQLDVKAINRSTEFRNGIIDGLVATDGNLKSKRIYTASFAAVQSICAVLASMGIPTNVRTDDRDGSTTLSDNPVYCIRMYDANKGQKSYGNIYRKDGDFMWFRIDSIEPALDVSTSVGYCFEVLDDDEPYFMLPSGLVTHNCRLRLDLRELRKKSGGFFGSGESTGSIGVVTINMPRLAYLAESEDDFYKRLDHMMDLAARSLVTKRKVVTSLLENGLYPYTKHYLGTFENHFSTIGLVGMNEACLNARWLREDLTHENAQRFTKDVLNHMRERLSDYQEQYGDLFNLEATPAESTAYRLARHDVERYPDIITSGDKNGAPYYTNSSHLPVGFTDDIFSALDIQDELQTLYTSGTVFHAFLGEKLPDWKAAANLVRKIAENYKLPYYTLSPTYSICKEHGYLAGEQFTCPHCGKPAEVYSRITGYYRPVQNWNDGKAQEYKERKTYRVGSGYAGVVDNDCADEPKAEPKTSTDVTAMLFTTSTCPNCPIAKELLADAGFGYEEKLAEENADLCRKYGIMQAPTLVVANGDDVAKYRGVSEIKRFLNESGIA